MLAERPWIDEGDEFILAVAIGVLQQGRAVFPCFRQIGHSAVSGSVDHARRNSPATFIFHDILVQDIPGLELQ